MLNIPPLRAPLFTSPTSPYLCSVLVIGGGSGGLACANELTRLGVKDVVIAEYVRPHGGRGTQWGLGGTCVNVGCVPKKLMHHAGMYGGAWTRGEMQAYGFSAGGGNDDPDRGIAHDYGKLIKTVQNHIKMLNWTYSGALTRGGTKVLDGLAQIQDPRERLAVVINPTTKQETFVKASEAIVLAMGGRPIIPDNVPGAKEYGITSDDIFSITEPPGKVLVVGASYVALECASFLAGLGYPTSVAVRSTPLKGDVFDNECAERLLEIMRDGQGVHLLRNVSPTSLTKNQHDGSITVQFSNGSHDEFDTVMFGTGRKPDVLMGGPYLSSLPRHDTGRIPVKSAWDYRVITNNVEEGIYAIGDAADTNLPELTPIAIREGEICAAQIAAKHDESKWREIALRRNPESIPSTVFTSPSEYGRIGLSEDAAKQRFGDVRVYLKQWQNLEIAAAHPNSPFPDALFPDTCFSKLICLPNDGKVVGMHYISPHAGEAIQGLALAINMGATKRDVDELVVGIHPTDVESMLGGELKVDKASGADFRMQEGCGGGRCG